MGRNSFFDDLYNPLYEPLPDSAPYLERIGMGPVIKADRATLDALVYAHQTNVPFENLDVYDRDADISLNIPALYEKIALNRRGGYCFELNAAFMALLRSVGYECYAVASRVLLNIDRMMPISHRGTLVTIDGVRYFCDVGFGGPSPQTALMIDEEGKQQSGPNVFFVTRDERGTIINRMHNGVKETTLAFTETPCDPIDFIALNFYQSHSKTSMFKTMRVCNLLTKTGAITMSNNVLKVHDGGDVMEKTLETEDEIRSALKEYYKVDVDFPLKV